MVRKKVYHYIPIVVTLLINLALIFVRLTVIEEQLLEVSLPVFVVRKNLLNKWKTLDLIMKHTTMVPIMMVIMMMIMTITIHQRLIKATEATFSTP